MLRNAPPPSILAQAAAPHVPSCKYRRSEEGDRETDCLHASLRLSPHPALVFLHWYPSPRLSIPIHICTVHVRRDGSALALLQPCRLSPADAHSRRCCLRLRAPIAEIVEKTAAAAASS